MKVQEASAGFRYLRPEDVRKLSSFEFAPKAVAEGYFAGRHRSRRRGASTEFRDYRPFVFGDDRAQVDWRAFARTDRLYLRTFEQETSTDGHIFLDSSASMGYGDTLTKLEYASFFAAALAYLIVKGKDRVSLQIFDDRIRHHVPPGSTQRHLQNLMVALERNQPGGHTNISEALHKCFPLLRRRGAIIIISDFLDRPEAIFEALNPYLHRGFRIHLCQILTPEELELRVAGLAAFVDMETGEKVIAHADTIRAGYLASLQAHLSAIRQLATRRQVAYSVARTDETYFQLFDRLLP